MHLFDRLNRAFARITPIPTTQRVFFVEHLRVMVKAGLSIVEALSVLERQMEHPRFKEMLKGLRESVESGRALSESLAKYPKIFPAMYVNMVAAGEISGKLEESLTEIAMQIRKTHEMKSKIRGAMVYPAVVMIAVVGVGIEMMVVVLPRMLTIFKELPGAELPIATRVLIAVSDFLNARILGIPNAVLLVFLGVAAVFGLSRLVKLPRARAIWHLMTVSAPIFGPIVRKVNLARFSLTLSSLLKSTIPIVRAFEITAEVVGNVHYKTQLLRTAKDIKAGRPIAESLEASRKLFPPLVTQMIYVGERSGTVDSLLENLSLFYSEEVDRTLKNFSTVIEPLILILLGFVVGGMAVAVIMPMYSLSQHITA